jgi:hypothetical protein
LVREPSANRRSMERWRRASCLEAETATIAIQHIGPYGVG